MKLRISLSDNGAQLPSRFPLHSPVYLTFKNVALEAEILGVKFIAGKVLYTLAVFTGHVETSMEGQYGLINSIGWGPDGREYIRIADVDSYFITPFEGPEMLDRRTIPEAVRQPKQPLPELPIEATLIKDEPEPEYTLKKPGHNCRCMRPQNGLCQQEYCPRTYKIQDPLTSD